jgi:hypothetical protein
MILLIITCPSLYPTRVPRLLDALRQSGLSALCSSTHIISGSDEFISLETECHYVPKNWSSDIRAGWGAFLGNILATQPKSADLSLCDRLSLSSKIHPSVALPPRLLTQGEQSVFRRHIYACKIVTSLGEPALVLEDDATILEGSNISDLVMTLQLLCLGPSFIDLADDFIPPWASATPYPTTQGIEFLSYHVAITRTLLGYAIGPSLASALYSSSKQFSLPIDMHYQKVFCELKISGFRPSIDFLRHGSKSGEFASSLI